MNTTSRTRLLFTRPLYLSIAVATAIEFINFLLFGLLLSGEGSLLQAFLWTVGIGGIALGSFLGVLIDVVVVGTARGRDALWTTTILSTLTLGLVAKVFTWNVGFAYEALGAAQWPLVYLVTGIMMAVAGGLLLGWLLFTRQGNLWLERYGV